MGWCSTFFGRSCTPQRPSTRLWHGAVTCSPTPTASLRAKREIAILRIGYRCRSGYEFAQHTRVGQRCGLSLDEVEAIKGDPADPRWTEAERALLVASDELHQSHFISDGTWKQLCEHFTDKQRMDLVFTVGQYTQVSMILNSFGVQLDPGQELDPDLRA